MLQIVMPERELFNEETGEFITYKKQPLQLEHSLVSLSKWESKWKKPFLTMEPRTREEMIDYIRCMTINQGVDPNVYNAIDLDTFKQIEAYIADSHTATTIVDRSGRSGGRQTVTSELIYYWMIDCGIPFECQKWHLNRLLTLIRICHIKQGPEKAMSKAGIFAENRALNNARRKAIGTRG